MPETPVVLFAYARPDNLRRTLDCLKADRVPTIHAFSDGPRSETDARDVEAVRVILREVDWCNISIVERSTNFGLGHSIVTGVSAVLKDHDRVIVFEDDLVCVPGTYAYLSAALRAYENDERVMSVTGWTHSRITPSNTRDAPYFDGRAECWVWGTWSRAWNGMDQTAESLMNACSAKGIDVHRYGSDLVQMATTETERNIWAVRFNYLHILDGRLCMRPPWSMVDHVGFDERATNAGAEIWLKNPPLKASPPIPQQWPTPVENPECPSLHRAFADGAPQRVGSFRRLLNTFARSWRASNTP